MQKEPQGKTPVCIGVVSGPLNGEIARSYLESAGISAFVQPNALGAIYGMSAGDFGDVAIYVSADIAEEARRVFAELVFS